MKEHQFAHLVAGTVIVLASLISLAFGVSDAWVGLAVGLAIAVW